jgi:plasmid stabilization system protein ParE
MSLPLIVNPLAEQDLVEAKTWYDEQRQGLGAEFLDCVNDVFDTIRRMPELYGRVHHDIRRALVKRFPYGIFYRIDETQITVVAVYHASRDPRSWQARAD